MAEILKNIIGKKVVIGDIHIDELIFAVINDFQFKKKYDSIHFCKFDKINELINFVNSYDYFIFFKKYDCLCAELINELVKSNKIIFLDELCKIVLKIPFDRTIEDIIDNLQDTYYYIFGYNYYMDKDNNANVINYLIKILKYLKINLLCDYNLFDSIITYKYDVLTVISFNVFTSKNDLKKCETERQISHLKYINADILFLQECSGEIETKLTNYDCIKTPSHCGYTYLLIKKILKPTFINYICQDGVILSLINTIYGDYILGSLHMIPYDDYEDIDFRLEQIEMFEEWINLNNLQNKPIIIGGDTNMTNYESEEIKKRNFFQELSNPSYPNRQIMYKKAKIYAFDIKKDFNYDKFLVKNVKINNYKTINTLDSDHFLNFLSINFI
jgi:exonuclease III